MKPEQEPKKNLLEDDSFRTALLLVGANIVAISTTAFLSAMGSDLYEAAKDMTIALHLLETGYYGVNLTVDQESIPRTERVRNAINATLPFIASAATLAFVP